MLEDKVVHFIFAFVIVVFFSLFSLVGLGVIIAAFCLVGKEIVDRLDGREVNIWDLFADMLGILAGALVGMLMWGML